MDSLSGAASARKQQMGRRARALPVLMVAVAAPLAIPGILGFAASGTVGGRGGALQPAPLLRRHAAAAAIEEPAAAGAATDGIADAKARLLDEIADPFFAEEALKPEGKPMRGRVDEAIMQLERLSPTPEPAYSELLDGTWKVKHSGAFAPGLLASPTRELALFLYSGGYSPGNLLASFAEGFWGQTLGLQVGDRTVQIQGGRDIAAAADVEIAGQKETLRYDAELMPLSASRLSEEVVSFDLPGPLGRQDAPLELRRTMLVTYLDEELLIVRDESGVAEVLVKELSEVAPAAPAPEAGPNTTTANATADAATAGPKAATPSP
mmetsp:Transcript_142907/g.398173  ORF Transcript_142907/g.398173 Transcript_142907/m.398173 type:complete len:323 (-) Transcript_142907:182-1150(-)